MKLNMKRGLVFLLILTLMSSVMPFAFAVESEKGWEYVADMSMYRKLFRAETVSSKIYVFGGYDNNSYAPNKVEEYDPSSNSWKAKKSMPTARGRIASVVLDGKIYAIGGEKLTAVGSSGFLSTTLDKVEVYDPLADTWETKSPLKTPASDLHAITYNRKIYVINNNASTLEEYDPETDVWESKTAPPEKKTDFDLQVLNGDIYLIGGRYSKSLSSVHKYNIATNTWTQISELNNPRNMFNTVILNGEIYAIGGQQENNNKFLSSVESYNPKTDKWEEKQDMLFPRRDFKTVILGNKIISIGGISSVGNNYLSSVESYDPISNKWSELPSLQSKRRSFGMAIINSEIYVVGGFGDKEDLKSVEKLSLGENTNPNLSPTLTVSASPNKVKVGNRFTTTVAIHNVSNIYAEDIKIDYDAERFEYLGASAKDGLKIYKEDTSKPGSVRFIVAHLGKNSGATGDKDLIELTFKAKSVGIGKVDITKSRIADNDVLEMDVAEENCGEDTIEVEANKDVNRTGEYTLLDLGIDAYYYGLQADQTDTTRFDTDVIPDGVIDDKDLTAITQSILDNSNYPFN